MQCRRVRPGVRAAAAAVMTGVAITICTGCSAPDELGQAPSRSVVTSTTKIAGAGVLGNNRRPDESCPADPAPLDPGPPTRPVSSGTDRGDIDVPEDPQRIVALSGDQLDALCALGLQSRIVGAALPDGTPDHPGSQPSYLGTVVHDVPGVGTRSAPDPTGIAAARPDLILGSQALTPQSYAELLAIAPTVFTGAPGPRWQDTLRSVGAATGRGSAADELIGEFADRARQTGVADDAAHFQVSVVQLTENTLRVYGEDNFPASVLAAVGVDRPASQRFTDKPFTEIAASADLSAADGDIIYLSFDSPAAKEHAAAVMDSDGWRALSAVRDNRVFVVNNEVWQTGQGLVAARGIMDDLRWVNAPIN